MTLKEHIAFIRAEKCIDPGLRSAVFEHIVSQLRDAGADIKAVNDKCYYVIFSDHSLIPYSVRVRRHDCIQIETSIDGGDWTKLGEYQSAQDALHRIAHTLA